MAKESKFDPTIYRGRPIVTVGTIHQGIRSVWSWSPLKSRYVPRKDGKRFAAFKKVFGIQKEQYFERLEDAQRWRLTGDMSKDESMKMNFQELLDEYFTYAKSRVSASTLKTYQNSCKHLAHFFRMPVLAINSHVIDEWLFNIKKPEYLKGQHKTRFTYTKELKVLKQVLKYYAEYKDRSENYVIPIKPRHSKDAIVDVAKLKQAKNRNKERYLTEQEVIRFMECFAEMANGDNRRFYLLALFQLQTGTRIGEAAAITWDDIDFDRNSINISKTVHWGRGKEARKYVQPYTKTGESRAVPMTESLRSMLFWLKSFRGKSLIFSSDGREPLSYRSIQYRYDKAFKMAGIDHRSTHILRHTFSTNFLTATKDHFTLAKFLGHASTRQTEHYAKVTNALTNESFKTFNQNVEEKFGNVLNLKPAAG